VPAGRDPGAPVPLVHRVDGEHAHAHVRVGQQLALAAVGVEARVEVDVRQVAARAPAQLVV
jgi:hypothetical protein